MARILLIGVGPLPFCNVRWPLGPGLRTWHFARPLLDAGHEVLLVSLEFGNREKVPDYVTGVDLSRYEKLEHVALPEPSLEDLTPTLEALREPVETFRPDAVVTAGNLMSGCVAANLPTDAPLWLDLFGTVTGELQAMWRYKPDIPVGLLYQRYREMLIRGDRFSPCSHPHRYSVLGELAIMGRINADTFGHNLVTRIPAAVEDGLEFHHEKEVLRGNALKDDDFAVLWSGGYNTWADVQTLFQGLEMAMQIAPNLHFVSTGGGIRGHHESSYAHFEKWVADSRNRDRYHLAGWVPTEDVASYYFEANLGVNVDLDLVESELGTRNRLLAFMVAGLPSVTTVTCELSRLMEHHGLCYGIPTREPEELARAILKAIREPGDRQMRGRKSREFAMTEYTFSRTAEPLVAWCRDPSPAPDRAARRNRPLVTAAGSPWPPTDDDISRVPLLKRITGRFRKS